MSGTRCTTRWDGRWARWPLSRIRVCPEDMGRGARCDLTSPHPAARSPPPGAAASTAPHGSRAQSRAFGDGSLVQLRASVVYGKPIKAEPGASESKIQYWRICEVSEITNVKEMKKTGIFNLRYCSPHQ